MSKQEKKELTIKEASENLNMTLAEIAEQVSKTLRIISFSKLLLTRWKI